MTNKKTDNISLKLISGTAGKEDAVYKKTHEDPSKAKNGWFDMFNWSEPFIGMGMAVATKTILGIFFPFIAEAGFVSYLISAIIGFTAGTLVGKLNANDRAENGEIIKKSSFFNQGTVKGLFNGITTGSFVSTVIGWGAQAFATMGVSGATSLSAVAGGSALLFSVITLVGIGMAIYQSVKESDKQKDAFAITSASYAKKKGIILSPDIRDSQNKSPSMNINNEKIPTNAQNTAAANDPEYVKYQQAMYNGNKIAKISHIDQARRAAANDPELLQAVNS